MFESRKRMVALANLSQRNKMYNKNKLRKEMLKERAYMKNAESLSEIIQKKVLDLEEYKKADTIFLYAATNNEVLTNLIFKDAIAHNKKVAFPKVIGKDMVFMKVNTIDELKEGYFSILEPVDAEVITNADIVITPGVAFDKNMNRVGYGKGFYDRYFNDNPSLFIAIAYSYQVVDKIDSDKFDIKMDMIVTEKEIYR